MKSFTTAIPAYAGAVIEALRFRSPNLEGLARLTEAEWDRALPFCDQSMLTLPLGLRCGDALPAFVRNRIASDLQKNAERWRRTQVAYREIAGELRAEGIEFAVLKGFSQCPHFVRDPRHRAQSDLDLLFAPKEVFRARDVARNLGYGVIEGFDDFAIDHLPRMARRTGWRWRGDFFDVEMPLSLELHFRLWDSGTERFAPEGIEKFWARREFRSIDEMIFPALNTTDALAYSTLHILRHLLRGDLRPSHVYELAAFLHDRAGDEEFWARWTKLHPESLRRVEAVAFCLASRWFDCDLSAVALEEIKHLAPDTARWLNVSADAPLASLFRPNKDEIWLHWTLLDSWRDRRHILWRRLVPAHFPRFVPNPHSTPSGWRTRVTDAWRASLFLLSRIARHVLALAGTAIGALHSGSGEKSW
jgi:Uncharacterised nucleotidyltransferase